MSQETFGLDKQILAEIIVIITDQRPLERIVLFGSRASGDFQDESDIDLAIFGKDWDSSDINVVKAMLEEGISTPLKFDVIHFDTLEKDSLIKEITNEGITIYEPKKN